MESALLDRHTRAPKHNFAVESQAWEIQPILIAPVLPGETLDGLTLQSRVVTPPLKSRVVGWWLEYYIFYVPFRLMPSAANLVAMFVDPTVTLSPTAAAAQNYYTGLGFNYVSECMTVVVREWFRREEEQAGSFTIRANRPAASTNIENFMDSLIDNTVLPDGGVTSANPNVDDLERATMVTEYRRRLREMGGQGGATDYEEILATYGASLARNKERDRPELIRYLRDWTYPNNTVEPTTGVPTTAASWAVNDRADKPRRFNEPGFIFGVQIFRPKVYFGNQTAFASSMLDRAQRWLPPQMDAGGDPMHLERSLAEFTTLQGPLGKAAGGFTNGYWLDIRDLFNYGDQYYDVNTGNFNSTALPTTGEVWRYATSAIADALLVTAGTLTIADGNVALRIKTRTVDPS
jgi:hypothetical protein